MPRSQLEGDDRKDEIARPAAALISERDSQSPAEVTTLDLLQGPGAVLHRGQRFIKRNLLPQGATEDPHAVGVNGAELQALGLQFAPVNGVAVERIVIPLRAGAGRARVRHGRHELRDGVGRLEDGVRAEDQYQVGRAMTQGEVEDAGMVVGRRPIRDVAAGGAEQIGGAVRALVVDAEEEVGGNGLAAQGCEHGGQGGGRILEADDNPERRARRRRVHISNRNGHCAKTLFQAGASLSTGWSNTSDGS